MPTPLSSAAPASASPSSIAATQTTPVQDRYVVIGNPVAHSRSPDIHAAFARQTGQALVYERLLAPLDGFAACVRQLMAEGGRGANITVPFKLEAYALADSLSERAQAAGAVNTLVFEAGRIQGDNTDGVGLVRDIEGNLGVPLAGKRVLLLGAGGAARGAVLPLLACQPACLTLANRSVDKAQALVAAFAAQAKGTAMRASGFAEVDGAFDVIINATAGSLQQQVPPVPDTAWAPGALAYDMMYAAQPTVFMQAAAQQGARAVDGLGMLVEQAAESFRIWRGMQPETAPVLAQLRAALAG